MPSSLQNNFPPQAPPAVTVRKQEASSLSFSYFFVDQVTVSMKQGFLGFGTMDILHQIILCGRWLVQCWAVSLTSGWCIRVALSHDHQNVCRHCQLSSIGEYLVANEEGEGVGWTGNPGLMHTNYCIWSGEAVRSCCIAQRTISSHLWWTSMEDNHIYKCVTGSLCHTVEIDRTL